MVTLIWIEIKEAEMNKPPHKQNLITCYGVSILVWALTALFSASAETADQPIGRPLEKITIVYSSISGTMAPVWVTHEAGLFRKHGLDAQLVFVEGGTRAVKALTSGEVLVVQVGGAGVLQANLNGSDVVMIAGVLNTMPYQFIVGKGITRPDQLKAKAVAVSQFGGSSDFATRYALEKFELIPTKDVTILEIGSQPARIAALKDGKIQGAMLSIPETLAAKKLGFSSLADLQMLGLEFQHTGLATTRGIIERQPDTIRKVMRAYVEGIYYYKTHRSEALKILQKYLRTNDVEAIAETYEVLGLTLLPEKPYPTLRGIQMMLRELATKEPKAQTARPEQFVDLTFIKELDSSGLIDALYKTGSSVAGSKQVLPKAATNLTGKTEAAPASVSSVPQSRVNNKEKAKSAAAEHPSLPSIDSGAVREHIVVAGDTLSQISFRYYRVQSRWMKIYEANRETIKNPDYIYVGQKIVIPADERASL
jgi:NitT/TauT family transport system substrate-binding protein